MNAAVCDHRAWAAPGNRHRLDSHRSSGQPSVFLGQRGQDLRRDTDERVREVVHVRHKALTASEENDVPASQAHLFPAAGERPFSVQDDQRQVVLWPAGLRVVVKSPVPGGSNLKGARGR